MNVNVVRKWKRIMAVGCSHSHLIDKQAKANVLKFSEQFKPEIRIHLGDWADTTCFRNGARGTPDESEPIEPDIEDGIGFVFDEFRATLAFSGNHEQRLWHCAGDKDARVSWAAGKLIGMITDKAKETKCEFVPYTGIWQERRIGNFTFTHGSGKGGINALQKHALAYGNICMAHLHTAEQITVQARSRATGICVGTLMAGHDPAEYARQNFNTFRWSYGFAYGETDGRTTQLWLHRHDPESTVWRLPPV